MLFYILHENYLSTFKLPKNNSESFFIQDIDSNSTPRNLVTVFTQNGKWYIKSNDFAQLISGGTKVDCYELSLNATYMLVTRTGDSIILYTRPAYSNNFVITEVIEDGTITVGLDNSCDVSLNVAGIGKKQFNLVFKNNQCKLTNLNDKIPVFCNSKRVKECIVDDYDVIFVMGIRMMVCGKLLYIVNDYNQIQSTSKKLRAKSSLQYAIADVDTGSQVYNDFYKPDDYFSKSPNFIKKIDTYKVDIVQPKVDEKLNSFSMFINLVPSVLMCSTSVFSGLSSYKEYKAGTTSKDAFMMSLLMVGVMLVASIVWPIIAHFIEKTSLFIRNKEYSFRYKKYIKKVSKDLKEAKEQQKEALVFNNISLSDCQKAIMEKNTVLFSINANQERFLNVRFGVGNVKMDVEIDFNAANEIEEKSKFEKGIKKLIDKYKYIEDSPYSFNLKNSISFINKDGYFDEYLKAIVLQLITLYDCYNLKIVVFTSENSKLNIIRDLKHCWSLDESIRFFATSTHEAEVVSSYLIRIMNETLENKEKSIKTHYLIISDEITKYRNLKVIEKILDANDYCGFSCLFFAKKINEIPSGCKYFLDYNEKMARLFQLEVSDDELETFTPEFIDNSINFSECVRTVANIPVVNNFEIVNDGSLPAKLGFLEMFNVGNVNQLNVINRWQTSQVVNTLSTPIGVDTTGNTLYLDLHEKAHGPHGLIAGMTGSGKSETIVTYILSLAVNYSPNEVQFVLIDYKGGGLAGAFENRKTGIKLPHLVGTITNLDKSSMNRTLVSIKSELQRRQRVFNEAKEDLDIATIDIYKYQELVRSGSLKDPMAHLFIICDEFAELKAQQPEFMDELVSAARIGRSLGIHLILATQKPSGVVDEQIWSNSKFKICAKVQTAEDSNEMIRRSDAAYIKESGRFFLQVGYDEIFVKAQSAYTGVKYVPQNSVATSNGGSNSIVFIDNLGNAVKTMKNEDKKVNVTEDLGDELSNVTKYLIECSKAIGYENKQLWLDNIPNELYLYPLMQKYQYSEKKGIINPIIGEFDDPGNQRQGPVTLNLTEKGNLWICGMTGSGKTTLLSTIVFSTIIHHSTDEINIFIMDLVTENLRFLEKAPQVADVVTSSEHDKINKLVYFLKNEIERRKKVLAVKGKSFQSLAEKGENPFPMLLVCINGYDVLYDSYFELLDEVLSPVIRESGRVGINYILTSTGSIAAKLESNFSQRVALRFVDPTEYLNLFDNANGIIPIDTPGRGLVDLGGIYEFQTTQLFPEDDYDKNLDFVMNKLNSLFPKASGIPSMPKVVSYETIKNEVITLDSVPIGFETTSNCVHCFNFNNLINLVLYGETPNGQSFTVALVKTLNNIKNSKIVWIDSLEIESEIDGIKRYSSSYGNLAKSLYSTIVQKKSTDPNSEKILFVISGYSSINSYLKKAKTEDDSIHTIDDLIVASIGSENYKFILIDSANIKSIDRCEWVDYYDYDRGILLAKDPEDQEIFDIDGSACSMDIKFNRDIATSINQGIPTTIKYIRN